jgi:acetolactate synthase-1/2/3 large subunit
MNGAESLVRTLLQSGVDTCFANPGTSEMHFVAALDRIPGMRCVLGLQENVVTGMADGYYRIAERPACTLLHCGPGLANGLANLHNARRAHSAIVNIVGDQASYHRPFDAPLTTDTEALARTVSGWVRTSMHAADVGRDAADAIQAAWSMPGQIATLILPSDTSWNEGGIVAKALPASAPTPIDPFAVQYAAHILREDGPHTLLLLSGKAVLGPAQALAWRIAQASSASIMTDGVSIHPNGQGFLAIEDVPYTMDHALVALQRFKHIILVNAKAPVGFFAYPGKPSQKYAANTQLHVLSRYDQDAQIALQALVDELGAPAIAFPKQGPRYVKASLQLTHFASLELTHPDH